MGYKLILSKTLLRLHKIFYTPQTLAPKKPPHLPHLIFPEKMLTPLYLPPSRLRRAASDCTISKVAGSMMAGTPHRLSLSKSSSEAAQDKASTKREGVHLHPLGGDFAPPKLDKFCHFSICSISQYGFFKISLPTPIKSAALFFRRVSASSKVLTPPVSMTGMSSKMAHTTSVPVLPPP